MIYDIEQRSPEWFQMRCGCITASRLGDLIKKLKVASNGRQKGDPAQTRDNYIQELVCERLTGLTADHFMPPDAERGAEWEEAARTAYQRHYEVDVDLGGFALHDIIQGYGASADFRVDSKGGGEIKCLKAENHLEIIHEGVIPDKFLPQMIGEMDCYGWEWNDFVAFNPTFPKEYRLFVRRLWRDETVDKTILTIRQEVKAAVAEIRRIMATLETKRPAMCYEFTAASLEALGQ
jgi:hypothetical protein